MGSVVKMKGSSTGYISKSKKELVFFVLLILFILCYIYNCPETLDLGRYYEDARHWASNDSIWYILNHYYRSEINFIYQTTLVVFERSVLGASFLTGLVVAGYYWFIIKNYYINRYVGATPLYLWGLLGFPAFIYTLAISRTACAVVIFYFGVEYFLKGKRKKAYLLFLASVFTHVISGMFVGIFLFAILLERFFSQKKVGLFNILCFVLPPLAWGVSSVLLPSIMSSNVLYGAFSDYYRFETYLGSNYTSFSMNTYSLADRAMMGSYMLAGYVLLNIPKYYSLKRCLFMVFFVALCFAGGSNFILFERFIVACSLFYALLFTEALTLAGTGHYPLTESKRTLLNIICVISFLSFLLTMFLARRDFFSFLN